MSGADGDRVGVSAWPQQWRWDDRRVESYRARGTSGVRVEDIECDGIAESALLLPMRKPPKWQGVVFLLVGFVFLALAGVLAVTSILDRAWVGLVGFLMFTAIGAFALFGAYVVLLGRAGVVPGLLLTPTRVISRTGSGKLLAVPWAIISDVRPYTRTFNSKNWHNVFGIAVHDPAAFWTAAGYPAARRLSRALPTSEVIPAADMVMRMNPLLAYHLVRHYFEHPQERPHICGEVQGRG
ncbi:hypothetical protein [Nocardia sp. NPDC050710]|uniref:hypothetical protein n=1 Tax=Nocardia sp. NPDC050710 TaxID=3157220 RepID=UPI0033E9D134